MSLESRRVDAQNERKKEGVRKSTPLLTYPWEEEPFLARVVCAFFLSDDDDDDACVFLTCLLLFVRKSDFDDSEEDFFRFGVVAKEKRCALGPRNKNGIVVARPRVQEQEGDEADAMGGAGPREFWCRRGSFFRE